MTGSYWPCKVFAPWIHSALVTCQRKELCWLQTTKSWKRRQELFSSKAKKEHTVTQSYYCRNVGLGQVSTISIATPYRASSLPVGIGPSGKPTEGTWKQQPFHSFPRGLPSIHLATAGNWPSLWDVRHRVCQCLELKLRKAPVITDCKISDKVKDPHSSHSSSSFGDLKHSRKQWKKWIRPCLHQVYGRGQAFRDTRLKSSLCLVSIALRLFALMSISLEYIVLNLCCDTWYEPLHYFCLNVLLVIQLEIYQFIFYMNVSIIKYLFI